MGDRAERRAPDGKRFIIGSDHAGYELKERVREYLEAHGNEVEDLTGEIQGSTDYPVIGEEVGRAVAARPGALGVLVCGTGIGVSIAANKVAGIRAALLYDEAAAEYARSHNDANVIVFGGRTMAFDDVCRRIEAFFSKTFEGGRHQRRNDYIGEIRSRND
jgi:ribose 5-phosphate isomerase B